VGAGGEMEARLAKSIGEQLGQLISGRRLPFFDHNGVQVAQESRKGGAKLETGLVEGS